MVDLIHLMGALGAIRSVHYDGHKLHLSQASEFKCFPDFSGEFDFVHLMGALGAIRRLHCDGHRLHLD